MARTRAQTERWLVREADSDGRPVTGVELRGERYKPGDSIDGAVDRWLVEQGYVEPAGKDG